MDHVAYCEKRARQAQMQSDAHPGETYDGDLDCWVPAECKLCGRELGTCPSCRPHVPQMVRELEGDDVIAALCGEFGRA